MSPLRIAGGRRAALVLLFCFASALQAATLGRFAITKTHPPSCGEAIQNPPAHVTSFSTTDAQLYLWFYVTGAKRGEVAASEYQTPSGQVYAANSGSWTPNESDGTYCYTDSPLRIAGASPAQMTGRWTVRVTYQGVALFTTSFTITAPGGSITAGANLIRNPGAEEDTVAGCASPTITGWTKSGNLSVCNYGGDVAATDPGPSDRGKNYFSGGPDNASSSISQILDISTQAAAVDAGSLPYTLSGYMGGWAGQDDNSVLKANFKNTAGSTLATAQVGPVLAAERKGATGMWLRTATGNVPAGARSVEIVLSMTRSSGAWNDGVADNLSFALGASGGGGGGGTGGSVSGSTFTVNGGANIFGAGHTVAPAPGGDGGGSLPPVYRFSPGAGKVLTFTSVSGSFNTGPLSAAPAGVSGYSTDISSTGGISGIVHHSKAMFLVGVFLDDNEPRDPAPARLDFSDESFTTLAPVIGQTFYIGDGMLASIARRARQYTVPATATRLFVGVADAPGPPFFHGGAGAYSDNGGTVTAAFEISGGATVTCTYSLESTSASLPAAGGSGTVRIMAGAGCGWTATTSANWISFVGSPSGSGNGSIGYTIAANTGAARTGAITVAGQTYTITQAAGAPACTFSITPSGVQVPAAGGSGAVQVTAGSGCAWTASSDASWIAITSGRSGTGNGSVAYTVAANTSSESRTGVVTIAGRTFTVTQAGGSLCTYSISPTRASIPGEGGSGGVVVTTGSACTWTSSSGYAWITITRGASGTGSGNVSYTVEANPSESGREGVLSIAGQAFLVSQAGKAKDLPTVARVVNAASYLPADTPGGGIAQGSLFTLLGANLGPEKPVSASAWPIEVKLADVSVRVVKESTEVDAFPVLVSAGRIDAVLPSGVPVGEAQVTVTVGGKAGAPAKMRVVATAFGVFAGERGRGPGILFHAGAGRDPVNSTNPARPGETLALRGTGLGAIGAADNGAPPEGELSAPVEVFVAHRQARRISSGRATAVQPGTAGIDEIVFELPPETPSGCFVPLQVRTGETVYSNVVTLAVEPEGKPCSDPLNPFAEINTKGRKGGSVFLVRAPVLAALKEGSPALDIMLDLAIGVFQESSPAAGEQGFNPIFGLPPVGTCTGYTGEIDAGAVLGNPTGTASGGGAQVLGRELDAGAMLTLKGPTGERQLVHLDPEEGTGPYIGLLGGVIPQMSPDDEPPPPPFLDGGSYTLTGPGGKDVGAFSATVNIPAPLSWINRDKLTEVDRAAGVVFNWSGGAPNTLVLLGGMSTDQKSKSSGGFFCFVPSEPGTFTVPVPVLSNMPATSTIGVEDSMGALIFGSVPLDFARFSATGLDSGLLFSGVLNVITVPVK